MLTGKSLPGKAHTHQLSDLYDIIIRDRMVKSYSAKESGTNVP